MPGAKENPGRILTFSNVLCNAAYGCGTPFLVSTEGNLIESAQNQPSGICYGTPAGGCTNPDLYYKVELGSVDLVTYMSDGNNTWWLVN
ncbi:MAG: hypothetical protein ACYDDF_09815 [Thermoplasmatota archaeon]